MKTFKPQGKHIIAELDGIEEMPDLEQALQIMKTAVAAANATEISADWYLFGDKAYTAVLILAESHITIHTYPEYGYAAIDIFTCGQAKPEKALEYVMMRFNPQQVKKIVIKRGSQKKKNLPKAKKLKKANDNKGKATENAER